MPEDLQAADAAVMDRILEAMALAPYAQEVRAWQPAVVDDDHALSQATATLATFGESHRAFVLRQAGRLADLLEPRDALTGQQLRFMFAVFIQLAQDVTVDAREVSLREQPQQLVETVLKRVGNLQIGLAWWYLARRGRLPEPLQPPPR